MPYGCAVAAIVFGGDGCPSLIITTLHKLGPISFVENGAWVVPAMDPRNAKAPKTEINGKLRTGILD
jgi:hypothetical protein